MLEESKKINVTGDSKINGVVMERYSAIIDETNPENMSLSRIITNPQLRKENREQCRADQAQFEDDAYDLQDQMISQDGKVSDVEETVEETEEEA